MPALTLEAGKFYRTRDGHRIGPARREGGYFNVENDFGDGRVHYAANGVSAFEGQTSLNEPRRRPMDIVAEWTEPDSDTGHAQPGKTDLQRLADAAEKIATTLEAIAAHLAPVITGTEEKPSAQPDADGWIEWHGGECPVPTGTRVEVRYRDMPAEEGPAQPAEAGGLWWGRNANWPSEIVAYRLAK